VSGIQIANLYSSTVSLIIIEFCEASIWIEYSNRLHLIWAKSELHLVMGKPVSLVSHNNDLLDIANVMMPTQSEINKLLASVGAKSMRFGTQNIVQAKSRLFDFEKDRKSKIIKSMRKSSSVTKINVNDIL